MHDQLQDPAGSELLTAGPDGRPASGSRRWATAVAVGLAVVLAGGAVAAVRLADRNQDVLTVAQAARTTTATGSARVTVRIAGEVGFQLSGPVDFARDRYALSGTIGGRAYEMRGIGPEQWTRQELGPTGDTWIHMSLPESYRADGMTGAEPSRMLELLTREGEQLSRRIEGDRTVLVIRILRSELSSSDADQEEEKVDVTVEIDDEQRVRRLAFDPSASGEAATTITYDDFGVEVDVQPPPPGEVAEMPDLLGRTSGDGPFREEMCALFDEQLSTLPSDAPQEQRDFLKRMLAEAKASCLEQRPAG